MKKMNLQLFAEKNIMDVVASPEIAAFWEEKKKALPPFLGEELFPNDKQVGMKLSWVKGAAGNPIALRPSAFDANVIPRERGNLEEVIAKMIFFKESYYIDEEVRQQLQMIGQGANQGVRNILLKKIFDDATNLVQAAAVRREMMRMQMLTSGIITLAENGQSYDIDYGIPSNHKGYAETDWSNTSNADPIEDLEKSIAVLAAKGITITRMIMNSSTFRHLRNSAKIKASILGNNANAQAAKVSKTLVLDYISEELKVQVVVYDKMGTDGAGTRKYIPDNKVILLPDGKLGNTWFGTTPEEADLSAASNIAKVSIVDTGVAISTYKKPDPVTVETKVSMIHLPSFEQGDNIFILTTTEDPDA